MGRNGKKSTFSFNYRYVCFIHSLFHWHFSTRSSKLCFTLEYVGRYWTYSTYCQFRCYCSIVVFCCCLRFSITSQLSFWSHDFRIYRSISEKKFWWWLIYVVASTFSCINIYFVYEFNKDTSPTWKCNFFDCCNA